MKKKSRWYAKVYLKNPSTGEIAKDIYAFCATEEDFVKIREELERKYSEEELLSEVHVEFNPYEVTEGLFKRK